MSLPTLYLDKFKYYMKEWEIPPASLSSNDGHGFVKPHSSSSLTLKGRLRVKKVLKEGCLAHPRERQMNLCHGVV